jgi:hypothetical protein
MLEEAVALGYYRFFPSQASSGDVDIEAQKKSQISENINSAASPRPCSDVV